MNPNQMAAMMAALKSSGPAPMPADNEPMEAAAIPTVEAPGAQMAHHKRMMLKAPTLASRSVHKKLFLHHKKKAAMTGMAPDPFGQ